MRGLMGILASSLLEEGLDKEAETVSDYIRRHRRELAELAEAHTRAVYGVFEYGQREAKILLDVAREVIGLLEKLEARVFGQENEE